MWVRHDKNDELYRRALEGHTKWNLTCLYVFTWMALSDDTFYPQQFVALLQLHDKPLRLTPADRQRNDFFFFLCARAR